MKKHTLYTAIGHFQRRTTAEGSYPVIMINSREYKADLQEMVIWTCLSWRLLSMEQLRSLYLQKLESLQLQTPRSFEECLSRLVTRGLAASGSGDTGYEALYDLLAGLFVVPVSSSLLLRALAFVKLTLRDHIPVSKARQLFQADKPSQEERRVLALSKQALLSTAELIKCVEAGIEDVSSDDKLLTALYDDMDTTSGNIMYLMRDKSSAQGVVSAVANLYLRRQIIFQRV
ncbi:MAG: hypothetical protein SO072_03355 [Dysosmobacter sp.]|nr:hypothetical protein [Dysosmobacter sp.]